MVWSESDLSISSSISGLDCAQLWWFCELILSIWKSSSNHISLHIWYIVLFVCLSSVCLSLRICLYLTLYLLHFLVCLLALELCEREHRIILASAAVDTQAVGERVLNFNHIQIISFSLSFLLCEFLNAWVECLYVSSLFFSFPNSYFFPLLKLNLHAFQILIMSKHFGLQVRFHRF